MIHNISLVHVLLVLAALACIGLVVREMLWPHVTQGWLFAPGMAAAVVAGGLFLIQVVAGRPLWPFAAAAAIGLLIGLVRGLTIPLTHDSYHTVALISRRASMVLVAVGVLVGICVGLEIFGAFDSPLHEEVRLWAALSAVVCAVAMLVRALALAIRITNRA